MKRHAIEHVREMVRREREREAAEAEERRRRELEKMREAEFRAHERVRTFDGDVEHFGGAVDSLIDRAIEAGWTEENFCGFRHGVRVRTVTPEPMARAGLIQGAPLILAPRHFMRALVDTQFTEDAHDIGEQVLRDLPAIVEFPVAAWLDHATRPGRNSHRYRCVSFFFKRTDSCGRPLFMAVAADTDREANIVLTVFGYSRRDDTRNLTGRIRDAYARGHMTYVDHLAFKTAIRTAGYRYPDCVDCMPDKTFFKRGFKPKYKQLPANELPRRRAGEKAPSTIGEAGRRLRGGRSRSARVYDDPLDAEELEEYLVEHGIRIG